MEYTIFFKKTNIVEQIYFTQRFKISLSDFRIEVRNLSHVLVTCPETGHGWQAKKALWTFVPCLTEVPTRGWTPKQHNEAHTQGQTVQLCHKLLLTGFSGHLMKAKKPLPRHFHTCTKYCNAALREGLTPGSVNSRELSAATSTSGEPVERASAKQSGAGRRGRALPCHSSLCPTALQSWDATPVPLSPSTVSATHLDSARGLPLQTRSHQSTLWHLPWHSLAFQCPGNSDKLEFSPDSQLS